MAQKHTRRDLGGQTTNAYTKTLFILLIYKTRRAERMPQALDVNNWNNKRKEEDGKEKGSLA